MFSDNPFYIQEASLKKDIAALSAKFPEGSTVYCKKYKKEGEVLSVGKDFVKVGFGNKTVDCKPSDLSVQTEEDLAQARKNVGADSCWDGYKAKGTKMKDGKEVPNCVKEEEELEEAVDKKILKQLKNIDIDDARIIIQGLPKRMRKELYKELGIKERVDGRTKAYRETAARLMAKKKSVSEEYFEEENMEESTKEYAKTLATLADKAKKDKISPKDLETLGKLADMMKKANEEVELDEVVYKKGDTVLFYSGEIKNNKPVEDRGTVVDSNKKQTKVKVGSKVHTIDNEKIRGAVEEVTESRFVTKDDFKTPNGIVKQGTVLKHLGGNKYEVLAGKVKGKTVTLNKADLVVESVMSDFHQMVKEKMPAEKIARELGIDVKTVKKLMKGMNEMDEMNEGTITVTAFDGKAPAGIKMKKLRSSSFGGYDVELTGPDAKLIAYAKRSLGASSSAKTIADVQKDLEESTGLKEYTATDYYADYIKLTNKK